MLNRWLLEPPQTGPFMGLLLKGRQPDSLGTRADGKGKLRNEQR
jgi:hypothetical protein